MTAEVGIMNKLGVALAADSTVTLGGMEGKFYTADKLFQLSSAEPIGVMVYGNANYVGLPWETIVKTYRQYLGKKNYVRVKGYADSFVRFLYNNQSLFPASFQSNEIQTIIVNFYCQLYDMLTGVLYDKAKQENKERLDDNKAARIVEECFKAVLENVMHWPVGIGVSKELKQRAGNKYKSLFTKLREHIFKDMPISTSAVRTLNNVSVEILFRKGTSMMSGVVIAGFGKKDFTPALVHLSFEGMIENQPIYIIEGERRIGQDYSAYVMPFAQDDMVFTFMEGIAPDVRDYINSSTERLFKEFASILIQQLSGLLKNPDDLRKELSSNEINNMLKKLFENWKSMSHQKYWGPVMNVVAALPKNELAAMAEALVNLTKFKRRVSTQQETVGGPIDVAVITKGDGFVWVKRKHYYDPTLNPRSMAKYAMGVN